MFAQMNSARCRETRAQLRVRVLVGKWHPKLCAGFSHCGDQLLACVGAWCSGKSENVVQERMVFTFILQNPVNIVCRATKQIRRRATAKRKNYIMIELPIDLISQQGPVFFLNWNQAEGPFDIHLSHYTANTCLGEHPDGIID